MAPFQMDISYLLNNDDSTSSSNSPRNAHSPRSTTSSMKYSTPISTPSPRYYASEQEELAAKAAREGTLSPQALHDVVRLATGSSRFRDGSTHTSTPSNISRKQYNLNSPLTAVNKKRTTRRSTEVYRINKETGHIERREDMDTLVKIAADTYEPGKKIRRFLCFCDKWYNKREHLNRHVQLVHMGHRPFRCDSCNVSFGTKQNMDVHMTTNKHRRIVRQLKSQAAQAR